MVTCGRLQSWIADTVKSRLAVERLTLLRAVISMVYAPEVTYACDSLIGLVTSVRWPSNVAVSSSPNATSTTAFDGSASKLTVKYLSSPGLVTPPLSVTLTPTTLSATLITTLTVAESSGLLAVIDTRYRPGYGHRTTLDTSRATDTQRHSIQTGLRTHNDTRYRPGYGHRTTLDTDRATDTERHSIQAGLRTQNDTRYRPGYGHTTTLYRTGYAHRNTLYTR